MPYIYTYLLIRLVNLQLATAAYLVVVPTT